jgi:5-oxoprolinase (ATP-hydrolysing)
MLYERVVEVDERVRADGAVETPLDRPARGTARPRGPTASTRSPSCFMHAWRYPSTRWRWPNWRATSGFAQVSVSHEVSPLIKLVGRGDTTVVDAYLSPILRATSRGGRGAGRDARGQPGPTLMFMMSSGGLTAADLFQGKDAILSGPAGGVVGMVETGRMAGFEAGHRLRHGRHLDRRRAFRRRVRARLRDRGGGRAHARADDAHPHRGRRRRLDPALRRARFRVGPDSAGANPGPPATAAAGRWP